VTNLRRMRRGKDLKFPVSWYVSVFLWLIASIFECTIVHNKFYYISLFISIILAIFAFKCLKEGRVYKVLTKFDFLFLSSLLVGAVCGTVYVFTNNLLIMPGATIMSLLIVYSVYRKYKAGRELRML